MAVMESWTNVMKSDDDLRTELVRSFRHIKVVRWRRVVYVACTSGDSMYIDHEGGARVGL